MNKVIQSTTAFILSAVVLFTISTPVLADQFDATVQELSRNISAAQGEINQLGKQEDTLNNKIAILNDQINAINYQLQLNSLKLEKLNNDIAVVQAQLAAQKANLSATVRTVYVGGQASSFELLVSSDNIGDYFDRKQYIKRVNDQIQESVKKIALLEAGLKRQQSDLVNLTNAQKAQQQALASARAEQNQLLAETQSQEANYQSLVAANKQKLQSVYAERARLDALNHVSVSTGGNGGYPYSNYVPDSGSDPWGGLFRECVSYVAWKRRATGNAPYPQYWGNAKDWAYAAPTSGTPTVGAIAVFLPGVGGAGWVGHVAFVERVNGNGTFDLSEYNWVPYVYSYRAGVSAAGVRFIR